MRPVSSEYQQDPATRFFSQAQLLVRRQGESQTVISAARGGCFKHFSGDRPVVTDAGLILETTGGRVATSQQHHFSREVEYSDGRGRDDRQKRGHRKGHEPCRAASKEWRDWILCSIYEPKAVPDKLTRLDVAEHGCGSGYAEPSQHFESKHGICLPCVTQRNV